MLSTNDECPDLNAAMSAVGPQIFSFLPLGSLLNGHSSPMLVNTTFHDGVFVSLGQSNSLDLSSCRHLREIDDAGLVDLITKIVEISAASNPSRARDDPNQRRRRTHVCSGAATCTHSIKVTHLNLSRCKKLSGNSVFHSLRHMPNIERLLLSSASRFDAAGFVAVLSLDKLEYMDLSGCCTVDVRSVVHIMMTLQPQALMHLDLSGVSTTIDDYMFGAIGHLCPRLESLNISGAKKVTLIGVGLISYVCRDTLKFLSLRGCEGVHLPELLMAYSDDIMNLVQSNVIQDSALCYSIRKMMTVHPGVDHLTSISRRHFEHFKSVEKILRGVQNESCIEPRIFGRLEHLDIGLIGNTRMRMEGCIATIAWLNGGRLRHINLCGLNGVLPSDISVLASKSRHQLQSIQAASSLTGPNLLNPTNLFCAAEYVSELDLSCCDVSGVIRQGVVNAYKTNLRSLKLDYSNIDGPTLQTVLAKSRLLLRLSVRGCANLTSSDLRQLNQPSGLQPWELLEIDCRDVRMDFPLSSIRKENTSLLRLNNRSTSLGTRMLRAHRSSFLLRFGARQRICRETMRNNKRPKGDALSDDYLVANEDAVALQKDCCTIFRTGFSQAADTEQEMFACKTCGITLGHFVCFKQRNATRAMKFIVSA